MSEIEVDCRPADDGWSCRVRVADGPGSTDHDVRVSPEVLRRLAPGASTPDDLVHRSFVFLLEREPKESILRAFELPVIGRYFPAYEDEIRSPG